MSVNDVLAGTAEVIQGNALDLPMGDNSVDVVITSPPYFGLRSYQDDGQHYEGQIGDEATPNEFVDVLGAATKEMMRVVKPEGSIWVNLGDKYAGGGQGGLSSTSIVNDYYKDRAVTPTSQQRREQMGSARLKSLIGIPWRYAIRCIGGTGTTALVAKAMGRHGISVDLSGDYCRLAQWRTTDAGQLARAAGIEWARKPRKDSGPGWDQDIFDLGES